MDGSGIVTGKRLRPHTIRAPRVTHGIEAGRALWRGELLLTQALGLLGRILFLNDAKLLPHVILEF
jgi:hypothetical protein